MRCGFGSSTGISISGNRSRSAGTLDMLPWQEVVPGLKVRSRRTDVLGFVDKVRKPFIRICWSNGNVSNFKKDDLEAVELVPVE